MPLGTGQVTTAIAGTSGGFIPELWSDEIAVRYKSNLVLANLIENMDHSGKYGDIIHVPTVTRGTTAQQFGAQGAEIAFTAPTVNEFQIVLDQWWVHGKQIPDIVDKQALPSMRKFIVDDMSYSLALAVDDYLNDTTAALLRGATSRVGMFIGSDGNTLWSGTANGNTGNGSALADEGIRRSMQRLDDLDTPGTGRFWLVPPVEKRRLLAIPRYTEQAFTGESGGSNSIRNGYVGKLYGDEVYVSSNCSAFLAVDAATSYRQVIYAHESAIILATQIKPRVQSQYKVEFLSDALVADVAFGARVVRTENDVTLDRGLILAVPTL
jgi:hypothetical protein